MTARTLMIQGTMSSAGKSLLVTALCRIFARRGIRVAPFKAQNMSNNAAVCIDGSEIGRAQFTQALAAKIEPSVHMNPVLIKPISDSRSQVIVMGRPWDTLAARTYYEYKTKFWTHITTAFDYLRAHYELVIVEGAGSPVELNLKSADLVNMAIAHYAQAPVLLIGDIDRGGIFAQLLGTLALLEPEERALVKGLVVNKFRGDRSLFDEGIHILEGRGGIPVLGVLPYIHRHNIPDEDAVALEIANPFRSKSAGLDIAVIQLPHIANFDDFDPLVAEPGVCLRYVQDVQTLGKPDAIILPGTKSTIADFLWLQERGLSTAVKQLALDGKAVVGICGGYQMLGLKITDPQQVESEIATITALGLLPVQTTFYPEKATHQTAALVNDAGTGWLGELKNQALHGYEIHMGHTTSPSPWLSTVTRGQTAVNHVDGASSTDGRIWGCYFHGLFANENLRHAWLSSLGWQMQSQSSVSLDTALDNLADRVEAHLNMAQLEAIIGS